MPTVTRADVTQLNQAQQQAVRAAQRELGKVWQEIADLPPAQQRDILLDMIPAISAKYGDLSSTAAAEWYQTLWDKWFSGEFDAQPAANPLDDASARSIIRAKAGMLFPTDSGEADIAGFLKFANGFLDRNVKADGRLTVTNNMIRDPHKPRFMRVPSGVRTCPFCLMLASRGAVYASAESAGLDHAFHDDCNCEPVPEWGKGSNKIEGFDLGLYEKVYDDARRALENPDSMNEDLRAAVFGGGSYTVNITQKNGRIRRHTYDSADPNNVNALAIVMRRQHPELFRD